MLRVGGLVLCLILLSGCATTNQKRLVEVPESARQAVFGHKVPVGAPFPSQPIVSSDHPGVHLYAATTPWRVAHFRPNLNLPEVLDADIVNNALSQEKAADLERQLRIGKAVIWTFPRIVLLPCDDGCVGNKDYEKMAARFLKSYNDIVSFDAATYRGEMKIKVRWFRQKTFFEEINPLSFAQHAFGIEFPIEGNMLTLSSSRFGDKAKIEHCVDVVAARFTLGVIFPVSLGLRNYYTETLDPRYDPNVLQRINSIAAVPVRGLQKVFGQTDYSSRFEPITSAHAALLPAIDGLQAGEGIDVGSGKLLDF